MTSLGSFFFGVCTDAVGSAPCHALLLSPDRVIEHTFEALRNLWEPLKLERFQAFNHAHFSRIGTDNEPDYYASPHRSSALERSVLEGNGDPEFIVDAINTVDFNNVDPWGIYLDWTNIGTLKIKLNGSHPKHGRPQWLFRIKDHEFFLSFEHFPDWPVAYFYDLQEHKRHPSFGTPRVWYDEEEGSPPSSSSNGLERPSPEYWEDMETFRPPLEAPTAYLNTDTQRLIKPMPLKFGFFLGRLGYQKAGTNHYKRAPFVVFVHPIDKSYWIVFDHRPIKKQDPTKIISMYGDEPRNTGPPRSLRACGCIYEDSEKTHALPGQEKFQWIPFDRASHRVAPIERVEDTEDFWKEIDVPPFSVLRIPPLRYKCTISRPYGEPVTMPNFTAETFEEDEQKKEEVQQSSREHGRPTFEVFLCEHSRIAKPTDAEARATMLTEAKIVRPNPFKAKHADWKEYHHKWLWDPQPGDPPMSPVTPTVPNEQGPPPKNPFAEILSPVDGTCELCAKKRKHIMPRRNRVPYIGPP